MIHGMQLGGNPQTALRQVARVYAVLPAAPAWDATPIEMPCNGMESALFHFWFLRAVAGCDVQFRIETSPYMLDAMATAATRVWNRATLFEAGGVASGADSLSNLQRTDIEYGSSIATVEGFVYGPLELGQCVERIRVLCTDSGGQQNEGELEVLATFSPV